MKKLGCAKCGKVVKSLPKAQKGKINKDPFAPQVISITKGGKEKIVESRPKNDRGDNYENYRAGNKDKWGRSTKSKWYGFNPETKKFEYQKKGGSTTRLETMIPSGVTGPNMSPRVMKKGGTPKAKFGSSVPVQRSPAPGRVRSASGVGTVPVGKRKKTGGVTKRK